jgi:hypothetical protein
MSKASAIVALSLLLVAPGLARAHCDTLDGPVVQAARRALETGKVNPVLAWVQPADEAGIKAAFARALAVRRAGPEARALADTWFFETLVRVHRAGEGVPFSGLKPAGQDLGPTVPAADRAIEQGSPDAVEKLLVDSVKAGLHERFARLRSRKPPADDVAAGRAWVAAYVSWVHYVEGVHEAALGRAGAHAEPPAEAHGAPAPAHDHGATR